MVFACCRATSLSCPVVSCQSSVTMRVLVRLMVIAVVGVSRLPAFFSKLRFCSSDSEFRAPVGADFWCEHARVALRVAQWARVCLCGWRACLMGCPVFHRSPRCCFV